MNDYAKNYTIVIEIEMATSVIQERCIYVFNHALLYNSLAEHKPENSEFVPELQEESAFLQDV